MKLLLATLLLLQDKTVEESFTKMEQEILSAKTLALRFTYFGSITRDGYENSSDHSGMLLLKDGNKLCLTGEFKSKYDSQQFSIISDGSNTVWKVGSRPAKTAETPKTLKIQISDAMMRTGLMAWIQQVCSDVSTAGVKDRDWKHSLLDMQAGPDEKDFRILRYKIKTGLPDETLDIKLAYDAKPTKLLSRTIGHTAEKSKSLFVETYSEFTLNADIPGGKFNLPERR